MYYKIYYHPIPYLIFETLSAIAIWAYAGWYCTKQKPRPSLWKWFNVGLLIAAAALVFYVTSNISSTVQVTPCGGNI